MNELVKAWREYREGRGTGITPIEVDAMADEIERLAEQAVALSIKLDTVSGDRNRLQDLYDTRGHTIERLEKEVSRLQSLAVCSSDEGTCFYYKDVWEQMKQERDELKSRLAKYEVAK